MAEVRRVTAAETPAEVLNVLEDADDAAMQKAWKKLIFILHPDKLIGCTEEEKVMAAEALHAVHKAKEEFRESSQASGAVDVPDQLEAAGRPVCTRSTPGQRRYEIRWLVPEVADKFRPVEKYEIYGPRIFSHTGEPMEWVLLATLPKLEGSFIFVEESPTQQEVMWAGDRMRVPAVPLTVYGCNGRGRSEALYFHLPWQSKFPWLQGQQSMLCRQCCTLQLRPPGKADKVPCVACGIWLSPSAAAIMANCPKCHGEALWDASASRLDCRLCGRHVAMGLRAQQRPLQKAASGGNGGSGPYNGSRSVPPGARR